MPAPLLTPRDKLPRGLNVDQFLDWYEQQPGRYELHNGEVFAMSPARVRHGTAKFAMQRALLSAVRGAGLPCHVLPDGIAVYVSPTTWYEPDALVYCGPELPGDALCVEQPIVIVEVASPSTGHIDETSKLVGYFSVDSIQHYIIVYAAESRIVHHKRQDDGTILTRIVTAGPLILDPPGLSVDLTEVSG